MELGNKAKVSPVRTQNALKRLDEKFKETRVSQLL